MTRRVVTGDAARALLMRGMDRMTSLLRPTLGPLPRTVAIDRIVSRTQPPEILDSAATIARRTIQLSDPFEDMGAMIVRHLAWRVFDEVGDGAATAAVLANSLMLSAARYIAAGGSPVGVQRGIRQGSTPALEELRRQARAVDLPEDIARLVAGGLRDDSLAEALGEIVDAVGPDGAILVENSHGAETSYEYLDGIRWNEGFHSSFFLNEDEATYTRSLEPRVLVTDYALEHAEDLVATLEACLAAGHKSLFVVAPEMRDAAVGLLIVNRQRGVLESAVAVRAPSFGTLRTQILEDIAAMTGGRFISQARQDRLADVTLDDLGSARQAWATRVAFGILGGRGDKAVLRTRIAAAKAELSQTNRDDTHARAKLEERIGKLAGTAAVVRVGASSTIEQEDRRLRVEAAVRIARSAVQDGVVPGGGAALVACSNAVRAAAAELEPDAAFGAHALADALSEPLCAIVENAGFESAVILHQARAAPPWCVFDVLRGEWANAWSAGILDPLHVVSTALETAVSAASTALTADALVRLRTPAQSVKP